MKYYLASYFISSDGHRIESIYNDLRFGPMEYANKATPFHNIETAKAHLEKHAGYGAYYLFRKDKKGSFFTKSNNPIEIISATERKLRRAETKLKKTNI